MDNELAKAIIALLVTGIAGGIFKIYLDYKSKLMEKVLEKRLSAYMEFVKKTSLLPKYPPREVKWKDIYNLSIEFRNWYFEGHGLVLSSVIRDVYFNLQEYLEAKTINRKESELVLSKDEYEDVRKKCSVLRTLMARDLESRESPIWHHFMKKTQA